VTRRANSHAGLEVGGAYRVTRELRDRNDRTWNAGDVWLYLGCDAAPAPLAIYVLAAGNVEQVRFEDDASIAGALEKIPAEIDAVAFGLALARAIEGSDDAISGIALEIVGRIVPAPPGVAAAVARRVPAARDTPLAPESLIVFEALYTVATDALQSRDDVAHVAGSLKRNRSPHGRVVREVARAILEKMDGAVAAVARLRAEWLAKLETLALAGEFAQAEARIAEWYPDRPPDGGVLSRASLCEDAADRLRDVDRAAAHRLYELALVHYRMWASWSTSGGEGLARMVDVERVAGKQRRAARAT